MGVAGLSLVGGYDDGCFWDGRQACGERAGERLGGVVGDVEEGLGGVSGEDVKGG